MLPYSCLLRRAGIVEQKKSNTLECGDISIDLLGSRALLNGKPLDLTNAEYRLLCLLVRNANRIVSRNIILNELWDDAGNFVDDNTLSVYIRRLREKVETDASHPQHLITVRGFGYQWIFYAVLILGTGILFCHIQTTAAKSMYLEHDTAVISSLLEQGVSEEVIATALTSIQSSAEGTELLASLGMGRETINRLLPFISRFQSNSLITTVFISAFLVMLLFAGIVLFLHRRKRLYLQAESVISKYINNDYSCHLPQNSTEPFASI